MIGNDCCGATAQRTGKVVDSLVGLDVLLYDGTRLVVGETSEQVDADIVGSGGHRAEIYRQLRLPCDTCAENRFHVARALVGSEGTCVSVLRGIRR
jgi:FAD/FMN-containing dehydrogenase